MRKRKHREISEAEAVKAAAARRAAKNQETNTANTVRNTAVTGIMKVGAGIAAVVVTDIKVITK